MEILLVEDEKLIADEIIAQLQDLGYEEITHRPDSKTARAYFEHHVVDLLIMDIGLAGSAVDGVELAGQLMEHRQTPLIFLSAYSDERTLRRAQTVKHDSYLVKPCSTRQLFVSIEDAMSSHYLCREETSLDSLSNHPYYRDQGHFFVKKNTHYEKVSIADVLWISSTRGGVVIHSTKGKYMLTASLASFSRQLGHASLLRIHKSHIINKNHVFAIGEKEVKIKSDGGEVTLNCGATYLADFRKHFFKLKSD